MKWWIKITFCFTLLVMAAVAQAQSPTTVLVVANANNPNSMALAQHYMNARKVPGTNLLLLNWTAADNADTCSLSVYNSSILAPITNKIKTLKQIDYIVLCRNLPVRIADTQGSVDSALAGGTTIMSVNHYCSSTKPFTSKAFGMYLVTRLDGWSWDDATALVDHSMAAKPGGMFLLDEDPNFNYGEYIYGNWLMPEAAKLLTGMKQSVMLDATTLFCSPAKQLTGYFSWGSNDHHYSTTAFDSLEFAPGAIAETLVSTSASNLRFPGGFQSQIAQLIHEGVTGVKGYVAEPTLLATANPTQLFPGYVSGMNLAEAFYSASACVGWKDVVVGDPLCCPYGAVQVSSH
jgi:uncharacterized protein (TIGR03790 family)